MAQQRPKICRTLVKFAVQNTDYIEGQGVSTEWSPIYATVSIDENGNAVMTDCFYVEWLNSYGMSAIQQQADGIIRPARLRMPYVDVVYNALISKNVRVYKDGIIDDAHAFQLTSAADNYIESNKLIEFNVKKVEVR